MLNVECRVGKGKTWRPALAVKVNAKTVWVRLPNGDVIKRKLRDVRSTD